MDEPTPKELFLESLHRCEASGNFIPAFYERFMASSDEVRQHFRKTNFTVQNRMLLRSLRLAAGATAGEPEAMLELQARAESHDRHHLNIPRELYDTWLTAVIETGRQFDDQWSEDTENAWHVILGHVISYMAKRY